MRTFLAYVIMTSAALCILAVIAFITEVARVAGAQNPSLLGLAMALKLGVFGLVLGGMAVTAATIIRLAETSSPSLSRYLKYLVAPTRSEGPTRSQG